MKRAAIERNFRKIKNQIYQIEDIVKHTKTNALWEHEASLRKKIKTLKEFEDQNLNDYEIVFNRYLELLEYVSERLIEDYNRKSGTDFTFHEVAESDYEGYLSSGIISLLITKHIPEIVSKEFDNIFPLNPKNEYEEARKYARKFYLHLGETNTGKTYNAMQRLKEVKKGIYLSPLRILALENYERLNNEGVKCSLITGEEEIIVEEATHISCTIEKLNIEEEYDVAIIDEIQMIDDSKRGAAWTRALLALKCREVHVCGALNTKEILKEILEDCGNEYEIIEYKRNIPLQIEYETFKHKSIALGDALVVFSKKRVLELAHYYSEQGIKASIIYGDLPPEVRRKQYEEFLSKENSILITTDAIGMGVNLPIKRIVFMDIKKYDGYEVRFLNSQEIKQIAGRAGRKGIYDVGYVSAYGDNQNFIQEMLQCQDRIIEEAVLGPSEAILKIKGLPLKEKLALWSTRRDKIHFYRKMDVSEYLIILDSIKSYKLEEIVQWKLMRLPFDVNNPDLMRTFIEFIDEIFVAKKESLSKVEFKFKELYELETYYQKVNLYYSFSKTFNLDFDEEWVKEERLKISEYINSLLKRI